MEFCELMNEVRGDDFANNIVFSDEVSFELYENINANSFNAWTLSILISKLLIKKSTIKRSFIVGFWKNLDVSYKNIEGKSFH